jgi:hypothetical protein
MTKPKFTMFVDDTGDVTASTTNDAKTRFASLTGVIFDRDYLTATFEPGWRKVVGRTFGLDELGEPPRLHRRQMISPPERGPFACLRDPTTRANWNYSCLDMMTRAKYTVITVSLDKVAFYYHHPNSALDVYQILFQNIVERYFYYLRANGAGDVVVEAQNPGADQAIKSRFREIMEGGTEHIRTDLLGQVFTSKEIKIVEKKRGLIGLQMADLLARPAFAHCRAKYTGDTSDLTGFAREIAPILEDYKFYRDKGGNPDGYGRVWRPQKR